MQKKKIALSLAAIAAVAATGTVVYAQVVPQGPTRAQVQERAATAFDRMDANVDGQIDAADRGEAQGERLRARFDSADTNRDGSLAFEEYSAARDNMRDQWAGRGERGMGRRGGRHSGGERGDGNRGGMGLMRLAANADANGDRAISEAEFNTAVTAHFDRADANDDGVMTREEGQALRQTMRSEAQARRAQARPAAPAAPTN